ncbi:conserved domain protein [Bacteroides xylanisolvens SD CC 1b]|nr:conserved domain protein [Bacteroides xylanisolvens SD CC 1b]
MDLQPEMRNLLMRNGLQAHVAFDGGGYRLIVQGHDSPLLVYPITERQMLALTDWGTNTANKKAYNILTSIIGKDFYMPKNFVHARNANGRVAMGLHGYRIGIGEYGHMGRLGMPPPFLGWTPREQWGFHLRRVGGQLFFPGPSIVPERPDGRMKPGELQSGGYGFYYKGGQQEQPIVQQDVLKNLQEVITPLVSRPRSKEPAQAYKELIASPVYFPTRNGRSALLRTVLSWIWNGGH